MKKYTALLLAIASLVGLTWASVLTIRLALAPSPARSVPDPKILSAKDSDEALQRLRRLDLVLGQIEWLKQIRLQNSAGPIAQLAALPLNSQSNPAARIVAQTAAKKETASAAEAPIISLVYLSSDMQRAVINGNLYATGDLLPDGGRLAEIGMSQVVIDVRGKRRVLQVPRGQAMGSISKPVKEH